MFFFCSRKFKGLHKSFAPSRQLHKIRNLRTADAKIMPGYKPGDGKIETIIYGIKCEKFLLGTGNFHITANRYGRRVVSLPSLELGSAVVELL